MRRRLASIAPRKYSATRNYKDGAVTRLSPYISRGVLSTRQLYEHVKSLQVAWYQAEKFIQELAWRDYWQQLWIAKGDLIHSDLKSAQEDVSNTSIPRAVVEATTGIHAVDQAIEVLYQTGYMHNHMRMYVATICCNVAKCHWKAPAEWLYAHLLDGDVASNQLSWQWVAGTNSSKKYYANQDNINAFFYSTQKNTFLDLTYDQLVRQPIPPLLTELTAVSFPFPALRANQLQVDREKTTLVYNYYNLDPDWHKDEDVQRVLLIEPAVFERHPVSEKSLRFALDLSKNIPEIQLFVGDFDALTAHVSPDNLVFKEHPLNRHYRGREEPREWLTAVTGDYRSFFAFWKKCKPQLKW